MKKVMLIVGSLFGIISTFSAQVVERQRPAEWKDLVRGARFMDRFEPMKGEVLSDDVWGGRQCTSALCR